MLYTRLWLLLTENPCQRKLSPVIREIWVFLTLLLLKPLLGRPRHHPHSQCHFISCPINRFSTIKQYCSSVFRLLVKSVHVVLLFVLDIAIASGVRYMAFCLRSCQDKCHPSHATSVCWMCSHCPYLDLRRKW